MLLEHLETAQHARQGPAATSVPAIPIVQLGGAVDADPDQEPLVTQKGSPLGGESGAIRLQGVGDAQVGGRMALLQLDGPAEEIESHQRRLPTLPGEGDLARSRRLARDLLQDEALQGGFAHAIPLAARIQASLLQVEAVLAAKVADRSDRLAEQVEGSLGT